MATTCEVNHVVLEGILEALTGNEDILRLRLRTNYYYRIEADKDGEHVGLMEYYMYKDGRPWIGRM